MSFPIRLLEDRAKSFWKINEILPYILHISYNHEIHNYFHLVDLYWNYYTIYNERYFQMIISYIVGVITRGHGYASWMHPVAINAVRAERMSALQGSGLVRTVGPCAQKRGP